MRRTFLLFLAIGETLVALLLLYLGWGLPSTAEVQAGFSQAERVTTQAEIQVHLLRQQVQSVRQIELRVLADKLKIQTQTLTQTLRTQPFDFSVVATVRDAVTDLAGGLTEFLEGLDPKSAAQLGVGLDESATFLEELYTPRVGPPEPKEQVPEAEKVLKNLAIVLRQAGRTLDLASQRWPEIQKTLVRFADLLRAARNQLNEAVARRGEYEETLHQTVLLADSLAAVLPLLIDQLTGQLDHQDRALEEMSRSLGDFKVLLPAYGRSATNLVQTGRLLAWVAATFVFVHVVYLLSGFFAPIPSSAS